MTHLKRHMMPKTWKMHRKGKKYTIAPSPGPHAKMECIPLQIIIRDILGYAETGDEAMKIIKHGAVAVDGIVRKDHRYPAGFMDVIEIKPTKEHFRIITGPKGLHVEKIAAADANRKPCIIARKFTAKGKTQCIALHDGRVIRIGNDKTEYKPGETLVIEVPGQKIVGHMKVEKGANAVITKGRNIGIGGKIKEIRDRKFMTDKSVVIIESDGKEIETLKDYIMVTAVKVTSNPKKETSEPAAKAGKK